MWELVFGSANIAFAAGLKPRASGSSEDLEHIKDGEVDECTFRAVIYLSPFDNYWDTVGKWISGQMLLNGLTSMSG